MNSLTHEEAFPELAAVALDTASPEIVHAVRTHAEACPECGPALAAMEETVAALGEMVPEAQVNRGRAAGIRSRLVMRARAERELMSAPAPAVPDIVRGVASLTGQGHRLSPDGGASRVTPRRTRQIRNDVAVGRAASWYAIAATAALVVTGVQLVRVTSDRDHMRAQVAVSDTVATAPSNDSVSALLEQKDSMIAAMTGPDVKVVPLMNQRATQPVGRMMWNRASNDWIMVTYNLRPPKPGMTYQVWLVTRDAKISAGTFKPDRSGKTMMHARYALDRDALRSVAVTEEPEGGMPAPTGPMVIAGEA